MALRDHAYTSAILDYQLLLDDVDISDYVEEDGISNINKSADYPRITKYRVDEMLVLLNDPTGYYSPSNDANFFVSRSKRQSGLGVKCELKLRYNNESFETFFVGTVTSISQEMSVNVLQTKLVISDEMHKLFTTDITDFGLEKAFKLVEAEDEDNLNGTYPLPDFITPVSEDSAEVSKSVSSTLTEVPELAERGALNPDNFTVTDDAIQTEGGPIASPATGYPQAEVKSPYRHIPVKSVIDKILSYLNITNKNVEIPELTTMPHFSSGGRVGYEVVGKSLFGSSNPVDWQGHVTDFLYDTGVWYYLYSPSRGDAKNRAMLISYTESTDTWTVLWRAPVVSGSTTEAWKMVKHGTAMIILCTDAAIVFGDETTLPDILTPASGSYNAAETNNRAYIIKRSLSLAYTSPTVTTLVPKTASLKAMIGERYLLGSTYSDFRTSDAGASVPVQRPPRFLPDSRRKLKVYNNGLYYVAVNASSVGVAKVSVNGGSPSWVIESVRDLQGNEASVHFDILGSRLYYSITFKGGSSSKAVVMTRNL